MLGKIISIDERTIELELSLNLGEVKNIIDLYVLITDSTKNFIGEISNIKNNKAYINIVGEVINNEFVYGFSNKPSFASKVNIIAPSFVNKIIGMTNEDKELFIGHSEVYQDIKVGARLNNLFSQHFAIIGSTGSGKSCGFARIVQNLFNRENYPKNANIFVIDSYGEYHTAFESFDTDVTFKHITTNLNSEAEKVSIPVWLLDVDDLALLLNVGKRSQLSLLDKTLKFLNIFKKNDEASLKYKNSIISKALQEILVSGRPSSQIRDQFFAVLTKYNTTTLNLESEVYQPGYARALKHCLLIDENGKIRAMEVVNKFLSDMIIPEVPLSLPDKTYMYTLNDILYALDFALIDEGFLRNEDYYNDIYYIKANLETLCNSSDSVFFNYPSFVNREDYIKKLVTKEGKKAQLINININYIDDRFAKVITKIFAKMLFSYCKELENRASMPVHFILEEAHRYVQNDSDVDIIGYNIFDRISKEGRKYGVLLGLISQRPSELSETSLSQCNNYFLFKMLHPRDIEFVSRVVPNITGESIKKMQILQPGRCMVFGTSFKLPTLVKMDMPSPSPTSSSCDIEKVWFN